MDDDVVISLPLRDNRDVRIAGGVCDTGESAHIGARMNGGQSVIALVVGALLAATVGLFAHVIGYDRDRSFYAVVLTVVGALYVLFAVMAGGGRDLLSEVAFFGIFAALAAVGFRTSLWVVAFGLAFHGAFDFIRHNYLSAPGAPYWWPAFCGSYDIVAALGLALLLYFERKQVRRSE